MKKIAFTLLAVLSSAVAQAGISDMLPEPKLAEQNTGKGYVGFGLSQRLGHVNVEWVSDYGIAYAKAGAFFGGEEDPGAQIGFRYPYHLTGTDANGYYFGVYGGHLDNISLDGKYYQRLGAGIDLAYVLLNKSRISTASVGIGAAEQVVGRFGSKKYMSPQLQLAYSLSFNVF